MAITKEAFEEMIKTLDADGDGEVSKDEYEDVYRSMFPQVSHERFGAVWSAMDKDNDGNLTVQELAEYYGFNLATGAANEMTDEQILETLQMQAALDIEAALAASASIKPEVEIVVKANTAIPTLNIASSPQAREKMDAASREAIAFLENCVMGNLASEDASKATVLGYVSGGANVRVQDNQSETALHKLARVKVTQHNQPTYRECVDALLKLMRKQAEQSGTELRDDVNHQAKNGKTPLFVAIENTNMIMIELLLSLGRKEGPDPLICDVQAWTVLHAAVHTDDLELLQGVVNLISPARVKVMLMSLSKTGRNPLHISAYRCKPEIIQLLLDLGADRSQHDKYGNTAGKLAERAGRRRSKELIDGETSSFKKMLLRSLTISNMESGMHATTNVLAALPPTSA